MRPVAIKHKHIVLAGAADEVEVETGSRQRIAGNEVNRKRVSAIVAVVHEVAEGACPPAKEREVIGTSAAIYGDIGINVRVNKYCVSFCQPADNDRVYRGHESSELDVAINGHLEIVGIKNAQAHHNVITGCRATIVACDRQDVVAGNAQQRRVGVNRVEIGPSAGNAAGPHSMCRTTVSCKSNIFEIIKLVSVMLVRRLAADISSSKSYSAVSTRCDPCIHITWGLAAIRGVVQHVDATRNLIHIDPGMKVICVGVLHRHAVPNYGGI